jgi:hypothetical protein
MSLHAQLQAAVSFGLELQTALDRDALDFGTAVQAGVESLLGTPGVVVKDAVMPTGDGHFHMRLTIGKGPVLPSLVVPVTFRKAGPAWNVVLGTTAAQGMTAASSFNEVVARWAETTRDALARGERIGFDLER